MLRPLLALLLVPLLIALSWHWSSPSVTPSPIVFHSLLTLPTGSPPTSVNGIIEISMGSRNKFELNTEFNVMELDRVLGGREGYPMNYGFIPSTLMSDGDPLDILLISTEPLPIGVLVASRPIGVMQMIDGEDIDDKVVAVPATDLPLRSVRALEDIPISTRNAMARFFRTYKIPEGKKTEVPGWGTIADAAALIHSAAAAFAKAANF